MVNAAGCGSTMKEYADAARRRPGVRRAREGLRRQGPRRLGDPRRARPGRPAAPARDDHRLPRRLPPGPRPGRPRPAAAPARGDPRPGAEGDRRGRAVLRLGRHLQHRSTPSRPRELGDRKAANIVATGAQVLVTANPGCLMQVTSAIERHAQQTGAADGDGAHGRGARRLDPRGARQHVPPRLTVPSTHPPLGSLDVPARSECRGRLARPQRPVRPHPARGAVRAARRPEDPGVDRRPDLAAGGPAWWPSSCSGCRSGRASAPPSTARLFGFFPILWIVINAVWIYNLTVASGHFDVLRLLLREGQPRPADPGDHHRVLLRCAARGAGRLRHPGGDLRGDADVAGLQARQGRHRRAGRQHRAGRLRCAGHPDRHAGPDRLRASATTPGSPTRTRCTPSASMVGRQTPILALVVPLILVFIVDGRRGVRQTWLPALARRRASSPWPSS